MCTCAGVEGAAWIPGFLSKSHLQATGTEGQRKGAALALVAAPTALEPHGHGGQMGATTVVTWKPVLKAA